MFHHKKRDFIKESRLQKYEELFNSYYSSLKEMNKKIETIDDAVLSDINYYTLYETLLETPHNFIL